MIGRSIAQIDFDPFAELGIEPDSDQHQIDKAYRKLALFNHSDKTTGGDPQKKAKFLRIKEAKELLSDEDIRTQFALYKLANLGEVGRMRALLNSLCHDKWKQMARSYTFSETVTKEGYDGKSYRAKVPMQLTILGQKTTLVSVQLLRFAAVAGHRQSYEFLLGNGGDGGVCMSTLFYGACYGGELDTVKCFMARIEFTAKRRHIALSAAAFHGQVAVVQHLLSVEALDDATDDEQSSADGEKQNNSLKDNASENTSSFFSFSFPSSFRSWRDKTGKAFEHTGHFFESIYQFFKRHFEEFGLCFLVLSAFLFFCAFPVVGLALATKCICLSLVGTYFEISSKDVWARVKSYLKINN